jgi:hypothetical protein
LTPAGTPVGAGPVSAAVERYEALRRQARGGPGGTATALGLAVLVQRGVTAWLTLTRATADVPPAPSGAATGGDVAVAARGPLVACIAQMLLARGRRTA